MQKFVKMMNIYFILIWAHVWILLLSSQNLWIQHKITFVSNFFNEIDLLFL